MNSLVIYGSRHGNTQKIAYAIAAALRRHGSVQVLPTEEAASAISPDNDLVVIGGPTEAHRMTPPIAQFFEQVKAGAFKGKLAAAFDTRLRWPHWIAGSAASGIATRLRRVDAVQVLPPESFFVAGQPPELLPGELDRAEEWADALGRMAEERLSTAVSV